MTVKITIDCDNAAFEDYPGTEVAAILRKIAKTLCGNPIDSSDDCNLMDSNGNTVGRMEVEA